MGRKKTIRIGSLPHAIAFRLMGDYATSIGRHSTLICPDGQIITLWVQPYLQKYCCSRLPPNQLYIPGRPGPFRGAYRDRHERWVRDAMDAAARKTKRACSGRRSRVVLTPRRWRQVGDDASHHAGDGDNKARSPGRARRKPLKPLRRESRICSAKPVVTNSCVFHFTHEAAGAAGTRLSLRSLLFEGRKVYAYLGRFDAARS
jgi:hypothetical protein